MKTYTIYRLTSPSGKIYVGQTFSITKRFYYYKSCLCGAQLLICNSIKKYGWESFKKEIVDSGLSKEEANQLEIKLIGDNMDLGISLNIQRGGNLTRTPKPIIQLNLEGIFIKEWLSCEKAGAELGLKESTIRVYCLDKYNEHGGFLWLLKEDWLTGRVPVRTKANRGKPVIQLERSGLYIQEFSSTKGAVEATGLSFSSIAQSLSGRNKTAGEYIFVYKDEYNPDKSYALKDYRCTKNKQS